MHVVKMIFSVVDYKCLSVVALPVAFFFLVSFTENGQIGTSPHHLDVY